MFKGSENVGPGEHFFLIFNNGGNMNGTTNTDRTLYFEILPKNQLDLGAVPRSRPHAVAGDHEGEPGQPAPGGAGRAAAAASTTSRTARRTRSFDELAYDNFAYKHSVIGSMEDLNAATVDDVPDFFRTYYAPNNAVLAHRRRRGHEDDAGQGREVFRQHPAPAGARRRSI